MLSKQLQPTTTLREAHSKSAKNTHAIARCFSACSTHCFPSSQLQVLCFHFKQKHFSLQCYVPSTVMFAFAPQTKSDFRSYESAKVLKVPGRPCIPRTRRFVFLSRSCKCHAIISDKLPLAVMSFVLSPTNDAVFHLLSLLHMI